MSQLSRFLPPAFFAPPFRLTKQLSMNRMGPEQGGGTGAGVGTADEDKPAEPKKTKKRKKKFKPTGYPASRPMHKEVRSRG